VPSYPCFFSENRIRSLYCVNLSDVSEGAVLLMMLGRMLFMALVVAATMIVVALPAMAQTDQYNDPSNVTCSVVPLPPYWSWYYVCDDGSMYPWSW
jgi:hypothetical protein